MKTISYIGIVLVLMVQACLASTGSKYLLKPTGRYSVAFMDYHWINKSLCPDPFYNGSNNQDFSLNNRKDHCREIMARVYYPTDPDQSTKKTALYYQPVIHEIQKQITKLKIPTITPDQIKALSLIETYNINNAQIVNKKFPVLLFSPGIGSNVQQYVGILSDLVSHGYIVVAVNNTFISMAIKFPDNHVVLEDSNSDQNQILSSVLSDIEYAYNKIETRQMEGNVLQMMETDRVGIFGHSLGGYATVVLAHRHPIWFEAAAALDAPSLPIGHKTFIGFQIPFMHIHAANWRSWNRKKVFHMNDDAYFILMSPNELATNYTRHNNFFDYSTLQYQPVFKESNDYEDQQGTPWLLDVGRSNGYLTLTNTCNYLQDFFDKYLKNKKSENLLDCLAYKNSLIACGPGDAPY
jgi:pimeloyl-ACP methyl ester carboxylesterase